MLKLSGKSVYKGVSLGPVVVLRPRGQQGKRTKVEEADAEIARLAKADGFLFRNCHLWKCHLRQNT